MSHPSEIGGSDAGIRVLLAEDDERLGALTARFLEGNGLRVTWVRAGSDVLVEVQRHHFDVILLDVMLPVRQGIDICKELRARWDVPVIMLSARKSETDRVLGLEAGADDYVTKPFSARELVSRIHALVRRARGLVGPSRKVIRVGEIVLDTERMQVLMAGRALELTGYEFKLLRVLAERAGRVLSREQLLELAKGSLEESFDRSIDVQISKLRQKLGDDARQPKYLKTIRGSGYVLVQGPRE